MRVAWQRRANCTHTHKKNQNSDAKKMSVKLSHSSRGSKQTHISPPENTAEEVKSGRRKKATFGSEQGPSLCTGT